MTCFYVGKGKGRRYKQKSRNSHHDRIANKYGFITKIYKDHLSNDEALKIENERICHYVFSLGYGIDIDGYRNESNNTYLTNSTFGGQGSNGVVYTQEWKEEHSKRMSGSGNPMYGIEASDAGKVITGLSEDGAVTTIQVKDLLLSDYVPISDGYVSNGDSLETAIKALDQAVQNAVAGGGEINQYAFSNVKVGTITISATGKTDTFEFIAGDNVVLTPNTTNKTVTFAVNIPDATASKSGLMSSTMYTKLEGIASGAEVNVQSDWNETNSIADSFIKNKPTALSAFTNDEGFIDNTVGNLVNYYLKTETYTKDEVNNIVNAIHQMDVQKVNSLPTSNISTTTIYLVPKTGTDTNDIYDEYIYVNSAWEMIGNTVIDLSNYLQKDGDGSNVKTTFTQASSRTLPSSGETLAVILGKVTKYLADLKTVAFTGAYSDLTGKPNHIQYIEKTLAAGSKTTTVATGGTAVVSVLLFDSTTNEQLYADVTCSGGNATITLAQAYSNAITVRVAYNIAQ